MRRDKSLLRIFIFIDLDERKKERERALTKVTECSSAPLKEEEEEAVSLYESVNIFTCNANCLAFESLMFASIKRYQVIIHLT